MNIRIATRKSALALWQANHVASRLLSLPEVTDVELLPLSTRGDEVLTCAARGAWVGVHERRQASGLVQRPEFPAQRLGQR